MQHNMVCKKEDDKLKNCTDKDIFNNMFSFIVSDLMCDHSFKLIQFHILDNIIAEYNTPGFS